MATVTGHVILGLGIGRLAWLKERKHLALTLGVYAALSMLPDIDYLWSHRASPLFVSVELHGQHTHSLAFAVAVGLLVGATLGGRLQGFLRTSVCAALAVAGHIFLDLCCRSRSNALWVLWPAPEPTLVLSERWHFLKAARFDGSDLLALMFHEVLLGLPIVLWALWPRKQRATVVEDEAA